MKDYKDEYLSEKVFALKQNHPKISVLYNYMKYAVLSVLIIWIGVLGGGQFIYFKF